MLERVERERAVVRVVDVGVLHRVRLVLAGRAQRRGDRAGSALAEDAQRVAVRLLVAEETVARRLWNFILF